MTPRERRRAVLELLGALLVFAGCIVVGIWLTSLGPISHRYDLPDEPITAPSPTLAPIHRDTYTATGPSPSATVTSDAAPVASPAPGSTRRAVTGAGPSRPRASSAPSAPVAVPSAPVAVPSVTTTPPPVVLTPPSKPCVISVLGLCVHL